MKYTREWEINDLTTKEQLQLFGPNDRYLRLCEELFEVNLTFRDRKLVIINSSDEKIDKVIFLFRQLLTDVRNHIEVDERTIHYLFTQTDQNIQKTILTNANKPVGRTYSGRLIYPKTLGQKRLIDSLNEFDITFVIGPAGTGKTYLSVVYACTLLKNNDINKIILTRPAVEAGESLGFLPGDLKEKVDPYLRPIYDALNDCLGVDQVIKLMEKQVIEVAPLAYMRGRTLDDALIILDEAQNTTVLQMKMFLTRLGVKSKMIINGDITQIDLANGQSGLVKVRKLLKEIKDISFIYLDPSDVVRHPLVQKLM